MSLNRSFLPSPRESTSTEATSLFESDMDTPASSASYAEVVGLSPRRENGNRNVSQRQPRQDGHRPDDRQFLEELEATNKRLGRVFHILVTACALLLVVYLGVVVYLFAALSLTAGEGSNHQSSGTAKPYLGGRDSDYPHCVDEEDMTEFSEELGNRNIPTLHNGKKICFRSLEWLPWVIQKVNASIHNRATTIENKHKEMGKDLDEINENVNRPQPGVSLDSGGSDKFRPPSPVFAHLFLNHSAAEKEGNVLKWMRVGTEESSCRRLRCNAATGEIVIQESGSYFVYSHVTFEQKEKVFHRLVKIRRDGSREGRETLQHTDHGPASFLQGVFLLMKDETLAVEAQTEHLYTDSGRFSYFGMYMLRT